MKWFRYISLRLQRGFTLRAIGPNEARIAFDASIGALALAASAAFCFFFEKTTFGELRWPILAIPALQVLLLGIAGVYTRLKAASGREKSAVLAVCVLATAAISTLFAPLAFIAMWFIGDFLPIVLSRLLLSLQHSRVRTVQLASINDRGPVLIIGGAGYIGSHLVDLLLHKGYRVRVLDRLMYGGDSLKRFHGHGRFEFVEGDAADIGKLTLAMRGAQSVVHLAGLVGDPACAVDDAFTRQTNIVVTRMVREAAQASGARRFIFASSCSVYGFTQKEVDETSPLNPVSLYAQTKIDSERELLTNLPDDFFVTVLRFATVFGHSRRPRYDLVANLFTAQAVHDRLITVIGPDQWRPFIHVRDLAKATCMVLEADPLLVQSQIFNVGDERLNMTIGQLAQTVKQVVGNDVNISVREGKDDPRNYAVSFRKISSALGFRASIMMPEGIAEIASALRETDENYRSEVFSNLEMTKKALDRFRSPEEMARLYGPLNR